MAGRLKGKVAVVTAAGQGIGRGIAEAFIAEGATVIATDLDASKLKGLKKAKKIAALDVRSTKAVEDFAKATIKKFGAPDILMNCAGYVHQGTVLDCSENDWDFSFDLNVKSIHRVLRAFLPAMLKNGGGSIINIASVASSLRGLPNRYAYGATKAAVIGLTKAIAADYVRKGIRANAICPGTIQSPSLNDRIATNAKKSGKSSKAVRQDFIDRQPIGRLGTPEEIAAGAVWLASDESSYYTGQTFQIDGGMTI
jgi:2-keto-3-deoxy-L-fuconate dehydrogenase